LHKLAALIHESWLAVYRGIIADDYLNSMSLEERYKRFVERFEGDRTHFYQLLVEGKLTGAAVFGKSSTDGFEQDGEISAIYLREDRIGKGYGHLFFTAIEQVLQADGFTHFVLSLLPENTRAYRFYLAHGYEEVKHSVLKLGDRDYPVVVMRKQA